MRARFGLIFALSGAAALIYEVTWTRLLTLQVGHGVAAASTVLAAFMGGLAVGSAVGGRYGSRLPAATALRTYAGLELAIAVLALILPIELRAVNPLLESVYADGAGGATFALLRVTVSLVLLSVPAAAMGATFPVASQWYVRRTGDPARDAGALYAANTVGAAIGALLAGFVLLPSLGLSGATWIGVLLNVAAAAGAWLMARGLSPDAAVPGDELRAASPKPTGGKRKGRAVPAPPPAPVMSPQPALAAAALALSGFASLVLQVVWTRVLALVLGPTTYAFSTMVAIFIAGIAVGAAIASRLVPKMRQPVIGLAACLALSVGGAAVAAMFVDRALLSVATLVAQPGVTYTNVLVRHALLALALLAPMTIAFGAAFPFAVAVATRAGDRMAADLGVIYAANTTGAIVGALAAGFALIPWLGLQGTIRMIAGAGALGALALLIAGRPSGRGRLIAAAVAVGVLVTAAVLPEWDRLLLSSGGYKYASILRAPDLRAGLTAGELLYYGEGATGTVAVRKAGGTLSLAIDGKVDASNAGDMLTQRLLAHVPLLLHPDPKRVAILGLGSGVTLGSALAHPIAHADVLEISPEVVAAARYFDADNHRATLDPRTRVIVGDGRTHLLLTRERYDVIVSEPSNPWMAGIASLFTREFFEAARDRLQPGGVLCQWAHTYDISTDDLKSIVATFLSVFPDGTLWLVGDGDVLLVGSTSPLEPQLSNVAGRWQRPGVAADLAAVGALEPFHVLSMFVAQGSTLGGWARDARVQSDNRASLEFSGPRNALAGSSTDNATLLRELASSAGAAPSAIAEARQSATATALRNRGRMLLNAEATRPAYDDFVRALAQTPDDSEALDGLIRTSAPLQRTADARALLTRLAADPTRLNAKLALSRLLAASGAYDEAVGIPFRMLQSDPANVAALEQLASVLSDLSDTERLRPVVAGLRQHAPTSEAAHYYSAALFFLEGRPDLALFEARKVVELNPSHAKAQNLLGACLASQGQRDAARTAFEASIAADPRDPGTYANLAALEREAGNVDRAAKYFVEALMIDPNSDSARRGLAALQR
jgi:spermidine synthase